MVKDYADYMLHSVISSIDHLLPPRSYTNTCRKVARN